MAFGEPVEPLVELLKSFLVLQSQSLDALISLPAETAQPLISLPACRSIRSPSCPINLARASSRWSKVVALPFPGTAGGRLPFVFLVAIYVIPPPLPDTRGSVRLTLTPAPGHLFDADRLHLLLRLLEELDVQAKALQLPDQHVERLRHAGFDGSFSFDDRFVDFGATVNII